MKIQPKHPLSGKNRGDSVSIKMIESINMGHFYDPSESGFEVHEDDDGFLVVTYRGYFYVLENNDDIEEEVWTNLRGSHTAIRTEEGEYILTLYLI